MSWFLYARSLRREKVKTVNKILKEKILKLNKHLPQLEKQVKLLPKNKTLPY